MPRQKETLTLSVPPGTKERLESIALRFNITWGKSPSPSGLVTKIAQQELEVGQVFKLTDSQVTALRQAIRELVDTGHLEEAKSVITLLIERGDLEAPLRQDLIQQVSQPMEGWRIQVDQLIENKQSFHVVYKDSQTETKEYTAHYAEVIFYEKRHYLQIWCDETQDSQDLPELKHNRCLRLDRIHALFPISGTWHNSFDFIEVQMNFHNWLIKAYEPKPDDIHDEIIGSVRQITRRVVNPFWLIRELRRYGSDCVIVSPDAVRDRFKKDLTAMLEQYSEAIETH